MILICPKCRLERFCREANSKIGFCRGFIIREPELIQNWKLEYIEFPCKDKKRYLEFKKYLNPISKNIKLSYQKKLLCSYSQKTFIPESYKYLNYFDYDYDYGSPPIEIHDGPTEQAILSERVRPVEIKIINKQYNFLHGKRRCQHGLLIEYSKKLAHTFLECSICKSFIESVFVGRKLYYREYEKQFGINWTAFLKQEGFTDYAKFQLAPDTDPIFSYRFPMFQFNQIKDRLQIHRISDLEEGVREWLLTLGDITQEMYHWHLREGWPEDEIQNIDYKSGAETSEARYSIELSNVFPPIGYISEKDKKGESVYYRKKDDIKDLKETIIKYAEEKGWKVPSNIKSKVYFKDQELIDQIKKWGEHGEYKNEISVIDYRKPRGGLGQICGHKTYNFNLEKTKILRHDGTQIKRFWDGKWEPENEPRCVKPMWAFALYEDGARTNQAGDETTDEVRLYGNDFKIIKIDLTKEYPLTEWIWDEKRGKEGYYFYKDRPIIMGHHPFLKLTLCPFPFPTPIPLFIEKEIIDPLFNPETFEVRFDSLDYYGIPLELLIENNRIIDKRPLYKLELWQIEKRQIKGKDKEIFITDPKSPLIKPLLERTYHDLGWNWIFKETYPGYRVPLDTPKFQWDIFDLASAIRDIKYKKYTRPKSKELLRKLISKGVFKDISGTIYREGYEEVYEEIQDEEEIPDELEGEDREPPESEGDNKFEYFTLDNWDQWHGNCDDPADKGIAKRKQLKPFMDRNRIEDELIRNLDFEKFVEELKKEDTDEKTKDLILDIWIHSCPCDITNTEIAERVRRLISKKCSPDYVKKVIDKYTGAKIPKEFEKYIKTKEKKAISGTIYKEEAKMKPREKKLRMGNIKREQSGTIKIKATPEVKSLLKLYRDEQGLDSYDKALQTWAFTVMKWRELAKHFPHIETLEDVKRFSLSLRTYWKLTSVQKNLLEKKIRSLKSKIDIYEGIIGAERVSMIERATIHHKERQAERRQRIKDGVVTEWEDTGEKVTIEGPALQEKETEEEYKMRKEDDKKWGIKTE